jgi:ribosomal-protein-alanine N-acetyltransferase
VRIETERLVIRSVTPDDAHDFWRLYSDPEVRRFLPPGPPATFESAQGLVARRMQAERERGFAGWRVGLRSDDEFIGSCGLQPIERTGPEVELAYHYLPAYWNKGYGTEAANAVLRYGFEECGLDRIIAICFAENIGSWRIMEKAGMAYDGIASYYGLSGLKKYVADRDTWGR